MRLGPGAAARPRQALNGIKEGCHHAHAAPLSQAQHMRVRVDLGITDAHAVQTRAGQVLDRRDRSDPQPTGNRLANDLAAAYFHHHIRLDTSFPKD